MTNWGYLFRKYIVEASSDTTRHFSRRIYFVVSSKACQSSNNWVIAFRFFTPWALFYPKCNALDASIIFRSLRSLFIYSFDSTLLDIRMQKAPNLNHFHIRYEFPLWFSWSLSIFPIPLRASFFTFWLFIHPLNCAFCFDFLKNLKASPTKLF